ncbi:two component LuxR family transcriptional regulator [Rivularia sp. IAM M-261]|nr:two component LuxR family transcriptional regulator [Rivularia sp. IAM M-261]
MSKISVIVIEDNDLTRVGIRTTLQQNQDIQFAGEAINARDGLTLFKSSRPDIAIVDIGLPDKNGIELTKEIKLIAQGLNFQTKVLILTLNDDKQAVLAAFAAGADSYCMKDIKYDNLLEALHVTYNGNTWIDSTVSRTILQQNPSLLDKGFYGANKFISPASNSDEDLEFLHMYPLTERELEVLRLIASGFTNAKISKELYITVGTVKSHVRNILNKLCADDRTQAAVNALRYGIVT